MTDKAPRSNVTPWFIRFLSMMALASGFAACGSTTFNSHWRTQPVEIDGQKNEWQNLLTTVEGKQAMVGFLNDDEYLYVCLVSSDPTLHRQIMASGFTLWFDYKGGEQKRFGVRYPMGARMTGFPPADREGRRERSPEDSVRPRFQIDTTELEILGPVEHEQHRLKFLELRQIAVKMRVTEGSLVYELRVPLMDNGPDPYAIGTRVGETIGIGFEAGVRLEERNRPEDRSGDRGPRGGMGGGRGGGGFRGGGGSYPGGGTRPEPLDVWAKVQLATSASSSSPK